MQTIKTGVVVALLLAVCYGAFVALNAPDPELPAELQQWAYENEELEGMLELDIPDGDGLVATSPEAALSALTNPSFGPPPTGLPTAAEKATSGLALPTFDETSANNSLAADTNLPAFPSIAQPELLQAQSSENAAPPTLSLPSLPSGEVASAASPASTPALPSGLPPASDSTSSSFSPPATVVSTTRNIQPSSPAPGGLGDYDGEAMAPNATMPAPTIPKFSLAREEWLAKAKNNGELRKALESLSPYYNSPELTHAEHSDLVDILDALSREVIYSPRHLLLPSYVATANDTLASVAEKHTITPELLAKINQLGTDRVFTPGEKIKVVPGPFSAQVSLSKQELTIFLGTMYAGRFPVSFGKDPAPQVGKFEIGARQRDRTYFGLGATIIAASDPRNPYGGYWLNLGREICIHGTAEMVSTELSDAGCISLAPLDASDVYDILTVGSQVSIVE